MSKTLIKSGTIVPMDGRTNAIENKALLIEDDRIVAIDDAVALEAQGGIDETIDASAKAILPGFVNSHVHLGPTGLFRGIAEDLEVEEYFDLATPIMDHSLTPDDVEAFALLGCLEMIKSGNTCGNELGPSMEPTAKAIEASGMRGVLAQDIRDIVDGYGDDFAGDPAGTANFDDAIGRASVADAIGVFDRWHGKADGTITCRFANFSPLMCTPALLRETRAVADERGVGINIHVLINQAGADVGRKVFGKDTILFLEEIGFLGSDVALIHLCYPTDAEIAAVKRSGAGVVICPLTDGKSGLCTPTGKLIEAGIPLALCGDWIMLDPWEQMRINIVLTRVMSGAVATISAYDVLEMTTIGAARIMGMADEIGSLEAGKKADIVLVDLDQPHLAPLTARYDIVKTLVHNACRGDIDRVIVNGRTVVADGRVTTLDEHAAIAAANARAADVLERANAA
jgi:5-methylthioadenosine/S-adenosylhomocysteine deaminase